MFSTFHKIDLCPAVSANASKLDQSKILLCGKELIALFSYTHNFFKKEFSLGFIKCHACAVKG